MNFLDIYSKNFYSKLDNAYYLEDDLLTEVFPRPKKYNYTIVQEVRETLEEDFQKLIDLLCKRNYFPREKMLEDEHSYFLVINKALQKTALTFYSNLFEKSYGGYFTSIDEITLDNCIRSYFKIDFLDKTDNTIISLLTYYLFSKTSFLKDMSNQSLLRALEIVKDKVVTYQENLELNIFEQELFNVCNPSSDKRLENMSIDDVDMMNGSEFENFISNLFSQMDYSVNLTPQSGDQGIDLIVIKDGIRIGIQAKRYASKVSNKAIQEVVAGLKHYNLKKAIVITNNYFTKSAFELAESNDVILWDRNILKEKIRSIKFS